MSMYHAIRVSILKVSTRWRQVFSFRLLSSEKTPPAYTGKEIEWAPELTRGRKQCRRHK